MKRIALEKTAKQLGLKSVEASTLTQPVFHVSYRPYEYFEMYPRFYHDTLYDDQDDITHVRRISLSQDIIGASRAIVNTKVLESARLSKEDVVLYIYRPVLRPTDLVVTPQELKKQRLIFDIELTNEMWLITPRKYRFELIGKLVIYSALKYREIFFSNYYGIQGDEIYDIISTRNKIELGIDATQFKHSTHADGFNPNTITKIKKEKKKRYLKGTVHYAYTYQDKKESIHEPINSYILDKDIRLKSNARYVSLLLDIESAEYNRIENIKVYRKLWKIRILKSSDGIIEGDYEILDEAHLHLDTLTKKRKLVTIKNEEYITYDVKVLK